MEYEINTEFEEAVLDTEEPCEINEELCNATEECACAEKTRLARKCDEVKAACRGSIARLARDLKEANYNPYIKQTRTYKLEIYRNCNESEPIDAYETTDVKSFSACALAVATVATAALVIATKCIAEKLIKE